MGIIYNNICFANTTAANDIILCCGGKQNPNFITSGISNGIHADGISLNFIIFAIR